MTKVPPQPTPAPTSVCPECGKPPELSTSRTRSLLTSRALPLAIIAILIAWQIIASANPPRHNPWWEPLTFQGWFESTQPSITLADLREIADRRRDPGELLKSIESGPQGLRCRIAVADLPQVVHASAGVPPFQTCAVTIIGYPWTCAVLDSASPGLLDLSMSWRGAAITHPRFRLVFLFDNLAMVVLIVTVLATVWRRVCPPRRRKRMHRTGIACILAIALVAVGTPAQETNQHVSKHVSISQSDEWQYGEPRGATFNRPMPVTPGEAVSFASALCERISRQSEITSEAVLYLVAESAQHVAEMSSSYGRPIPLLETHRWNAREFPAASASITIDTNQIAFRWPNKQGARLRHAILISLPGIALVVVFYSSAYSIIRFVQHKAPSRRQQRRLAKDLCPHCAYPIPTTTPP